MAETLWIYQMGGVQHGPVPAQELCRLLAEGAIPPETSVCSELLREWVPAARIPAFRNALPPEVAAQLARKVKDEAFYRRAARMVSSAPAVAIIFHCLLTSAGHTPPTRVEMGFDAIVGAAFILLGLGAGVFVLRGLPRVGRQPILRGGLRGIGINGLLVVLAVSGLVCQKFGNRVMAAYPPPPRALTPQEMQQAYQDGVDSALKYPGWMGAAKTRWGWIAIGSLEDQTPTARTLLSDLRDPCSIVAVGVDNSNGRKAIEVDPRSLRLQFADGRAVECLNLKDTLGRAIHDASGVVQRFGGSQLVGAGQRKLDMICLIPAGLDLRGLRYMTIEVDGVEISVPGRYLSASEKAVAMQNHKLTALAPPTLAAPAPLAADDPFNIEAPAGVRIAGTWSIQATVPGASGQLRLVTTLELRQDGTLSQTTRATDPQGRPHPEFDESWSGSWTLSGDRLIESVRQTTSHRHPLGTWMYHLEVTGQGTLVLQRLSAPENSPLSNSHPVYTYHRQ